MPVGTPAGSSCRPRGALVDVALVGIVLGATVLRMSHSRLVPVVTAWEAGPQLLLRGMNRAYACPCHVCGPAPGLRTPR